MTLSSKSSCPSSCEILCFILACFFTPFSETPKYSHWSHLNDIVVITDFSAALQVFKTSFGLSGEVSLTEITVSVGFAVASSAIFEICFVAVPAY